LCYNIEKVKDKGRFYPLLYLCKNLGLVIGSLLLVFTSIVSNDYIFTIDYTGTGKILKNDISVQLDSLGVNEFSRFSNIDLGDLSKKILASNSRLTFAECSKVGNVLKINTVLAQGDSQKLTGTATQLVSDVDGVIEDLKVYRGTALVERGDSVKTGQVLVDQTVTVGDQQLKVNVLAVAYLRCTASYRYYSKRAGLEQQVLTIYEEDFTDGEILDSTVFINQIQDGYEYYIEIEYRRIIFAG
jgi:hypothetical protein